MDITPIIPSDRQFIESYGLGWFRISGREYHEPILVFPGRVSPWRVSGFESLDADSFAAVRDAPDGVELLLLGSGPRIQFLKPSVRTQLRNAGLAVELVDTGAACRTYNVLLSEERRVVAALLPI